MQRVVIVGAGIGGLCAARAVTLAGPLGVAGASAVAAVQAALAASPSVDSAARA
jgi:glycine/D-amino acid oxidase-like deaminating enzyme